MEHVHEQAVSRYLAQLHFICLPVLDEPGPASLRGVIERNSIALASNMGKPLLDPVSPTWLGNYSDRPRVRQSQLWNQNHVEESYDPEFLDVLQTLIAAC